MKDLIDDLLDALDSLDKGTDSMRIAKHTMLETCGFNRMGDKFPRTSDNIKAWNSLKTEYNDAIHKGNKKYAETIGRVFESNTWDLITRSFTSDNALELFEKLSKKWNI